MFDPKAKAKEKEKDEDKDNEDESGKGSWHHHNLIPSITTAAASAVATAVTTVENLFCEFCKHSWQSRRDYDKHLHCCRFFFQSKKRLTTGTSSSSFYQPPQMDENGNKVPSALEMFKLVQNLSERLVRTEKETKRLREIVSRRQRQQLTEWLVTQQPSVSFDAWMHDLVIDEAMLHVVFERDLTEGIKATIEMNMQLFDQWKMSTAFETAFQRRREGRDVTPGFWNKMTPSFSMGQTTIANRTSSRSNTTTTTTIEESPPAVPIPSHFTGIRPLRAFAQRPNTLYVYSTMGDTLPEPTWCILENKQLETLVIRISQMLLREFLQWQKREEQKEKERKAAKIGKENLKSDQNQNPNSNSNSNPNSNQLNAEMMDVVEEQEHEHEQEQEDWYAKREEEEREERMLRYMIKINGSRVSIEKRVSEIRRWLLPRLEENIRMMVVDFE